MSNIIVFRKSKLIKQIFTAFLLFTLSSCSNIPANSSSNTYEFVTDQSNIIQSGGFAGVNQSHPIEGTFQLSMDSVNNTASFEQVNANILEPTGFLSEQKLNQIFNLTSLEGTMTTDTTLVFKGKSSEPESDVSITLTLKDDTITLKGGTTPPRNSADFFNFSLDALAKKK